MMKKTRMLALLLAAVMCLSLAACGQKDEGKTPAAKTPEELATAYTQAINGARDDELNEFFPVMTKGDDTDPTNAEMTFALLGFTPEDTEAYGVSMSLMNVSAYAIVAVKPAEGKEETVQKGLENYIEAQKGNFQFYLEDQYEIASSAKLEKLSDGTIVLVMCEGQDTVFDSIKNALNG